jgi:hypothetical protein
MRRLARRPSPALIISMLALVVALGGTGYAAISIPRNSVGSAQLKKNAVTGPKVKDGSLSAADFVRGSFPKGPQGTPGAPGQDGAPGAQGPAGDWGMIPHPYFDQDMTGWEVPFGSGTTGPSASPLGSPKAFINAAGSAPSMSSTRRIPVNPAWTYEVRGSFRQDDVGTAGGVWLAVRMFDSNGTDITGDGFWWYHPVAAVVPGDTDWHTYSGLFGSGTAHAIPAGAMTMSVGAILNWDGTSAGDRTYEVTGLEIAPASRPPLYVVDTMPSCPNVDIVSGTALISTGAFTLDRGGDVRVDGAEISTALGRRDVGLYVDGTRVQIALARTDVSDWAQHNVSWSGYLAPGSHTIEIRAETTLNSPDGYGCQGQYGHLDVVFQN